MKGARRHDGERGDMPDVGGPDAGGPNAGGANAGGPDAGEGARGWVVVSTHPHREAEARGNLERQSFTTYCPVIRKRITVARRSREVLRPLFPGYMFVALEAGESRWRPLLSTYGVRRVLRCGDELSLLDGGFVTALKAREIEGVIERPQTPFEIGQSISITEGPFEGLVAQIVGLEDKDRVAVLLELLGKPARTVLHARSIAARSA